MQTAQFVFLSLQSGAAKLAPYYSCSQCASPAAPHSATRLINHRVVEEHLLQCTSHHLPATAPQIWMLSLQCLPPYLIVFSTQLPCNKRLLTAQCPSPSRPSPHWINCTITNRQVCAHECVLKKRGQEGTDVSAYLSHVLNLIEATVE